MLGGAPSTPGRTSGAGLHLALWAGALACVLALAGSAGGQTPPGPVGTDETAPEPEGGDGADVDDPTPRTGAELFAAAVEADEAGDLRRALELYREAIAVDPSARFAARAFARARALEPLTVDPALEALDAIKRDYVAIGSDEAVRRAEALLGTDGITTEGVVALRRWLAAEYEHVQEDPARAVEHHLAIAVLDDAEPGEVETALTLAGRAAFTGDALRRVRDITNEVLARRSDLDPAGLARARDEVRDELQRRALRPLSVVALVLLVALTTRRRSWNRAAFRPWSIALLVYAFLAGAALSQRWEHGYTAPFLLALPATAIVHMMALGSRPSPDASASNRLSTAALVACATFGAIFLVFDAFDRAAIFGL